MTFMIFSVKPFSGKNFRENDFTEKSGKQTNHLIHAWQYKLGFHSMVLGNIQLMSPEFG